jgi:hypothetical protein
MARRCLLRRHGVEFRWSPLGAQTLFAQALWFNLIIFEAAFHAERGFHETAKGPALLYKRSWRGSLSRPAKPTFVGWSMLDARSALVHS